MPKALGTMVRTSTHKDANLFHDMTSGKAVSGALHFFNQTPVEWFTKKQPTVETATHGAEFSAARSAIEQISGVRHFLRHLGVPIEDTACLDKSLLVTLKKRCDGDWVGGARTLDHGSCGGLDKESVSCVR